MMNFIVVFAATMVGGFFLAHFPTATSSVLERTVQLGMMALLVIVPYLTSWRINYRHWFPIAVLSVFSASLLVWAVMPDWSESPVPDFHSLGMLAFQGLMSLAACLAYTQLHAEWQRSIA